MTAGHTHRNVGYLRRDGLALRLLRVTVWRSRNMEAVDRSRFPYTGAPPDDMEPDERGYWRLTLLGFLHGLTGLTITTDTPVPDAASTDEECTHDDRRIVSEAGEPTRAECPDCGETIEQPSDG